MGVMSKWACGHYTIRSGSNILINLRIVFKWRFFFGEKVSSCDFDLYNRSEAILQIAFAYIDLTKWIQSRVIVDLLLSPFGV
ncbi:hypothetical protein G4B88_013272 [Cannabis sativa]|uniref:Uncharacterized protein n=1 Tax=Cannabis sativa TaxID=3483 RepID=A0A7J6DVT5_CANSA|nr:hypothetical protein G4B88_013272 [Cannabis sativa]